MKYSAHKVGGFGLGSFVSIKASKDAIKKSGESGFFQIISTSTGICVWGGWK